MVPQIDGTYNVSDDSDTDLHSYLDLASCISHMFLCGNGM